MSELCLKNYRKEKIGFETQKRVKISINQKEGKFE